MRFRSHARAGIVLLAVGAAAPAAIPSQALAKSHHSKSHHSAPHHSNVAGHVYVDDNTTGTNTIGVLTRHANGSLTSLPGSPFSAGGAGTGSGLASQGAIQLTPDGRFLIAVDAGSNQLSVLRIAHDGAPRPVSHGVVSSRGDDPVSVTVHGDLVYVANAGPGDANYTGFRLTHSGRLQPLHDSTVTLPAGSQPDDVLFNGNGTRLVGALVGTSEIDSFTVARDGRLVAAPSSPYPAQGLGPFGSEFRPTNPSQLFVSNAHNTAPDSGTVSAFHDSASGKLTSIGSSPFADQQMAPCWVEISHDGRFLFTVNTMSGSISSYSIAADGTLTLHGSTTLRGTSPGPVDARLSPDGRWLFVVEGKTDAVATLAVHGAGLTESASSPTSLPTGAAPAGIAVN